jgi:hypothetical protein
MVLVTDVTQVWISMSVLPWPWPTCREIHTVGKVDVTMSHGGVRFGLRMGHGVWAWTLNLILTAQAHRPQPRLGNSNHIPRIY